MLLTACSENIEFKPKNELERLALEKFEEFKEIHSKEYIALNDNYADKLADKQCSKCKDVKKLDII
ncbi:hypothetical protein [Campylobacter sp. LR264d]|uniref:hypothetical protein n=1 Tax=Campylobacter sp. LR264d TaxID=2593544 RepID=UPI00123BE58B|nr:hypothetical protein [Campylobacter sp. LR264d]